MGIKNHRQPYSVHSRSGRQTAAESKGTGRAISRVPRTAYGRGAVANMCRGGHMFAPTKIWRRWHRKVNINIKRYAMVSAISASAVAALVMSRGHLIEDLPEVPLVLEDSLESVKYTQKALAILKAVNAASDLERSISSNKIRKGRGKIRNRRYVIRKGPMVIYSKDYGISQAFRNLPGLDIANVERLNILKLAPGGHLGRFLIWTKSAVQKLGKIYCSKLMTSQRKKYFRYLLPHAPVENCDLSRLINSDEIQSRIKITKSKQYLKKKNTLHVNGLRSTYTLTKNLRKTKVQHNKKISELYKKLPERHLM